VKIPPVALLHALTESGWVDLGRVHSRDFNTKKQLFCAPDMVDMSRTELRRLAEQPPTPAAVRLVK
jgi:hypothetical protein